MQLDLENLDTVSKSTSGVNYDIVHPVTGEPITDEQGNTMRFTLLGPDSPEYKNVTHKQANATIKAQVQAASRGMSQSADVTVETIEELQIRQCVACTTGWQNVFLDKKPLEFNKENAEQVYRRFSIVRTQVSEFINDKLNFLGQSSKT